MLTLIFPERTIYPLAYVMKLTLELGLINPYTVRSFLKILKKYRQFMLCWFSEQHQTITYLNAKKDGLSYSKLSTNLNDTTPSFQKYLEMS